MFRAIGVLFISTLALAEGDVGFVDAYPLSASQGILLHIDSAGARSMSKFWKSCEGHEGESECFMRITPSGELLEANAGERPASTPIQGWLGVWPVEEELTDEITIKFRSAIAEPLVAMMAQARGLPTETRELLTGKNLTCQRRRVPNRKSIYAPLLPRCEAKLRKI